MTTETPQKAVGVEDQEALHRATIEKLYEQNKQNEEKSETQKDNKSDKENKEYIRSRISDIFSILYNPRSFGSKITGFETSPSLPNTLDDAVDLENHNIRRIRFNFGQRRTDWYKWIDEELDDMIQYYANGDISKFISDTRINFECDGQAQIRMPDDVNSRKDRIKEQLVLRYSLINNEFSNPFKTYSTPQILSLLSFYSLFAMTMFASFVFGKEVAAVIFVCDLFLYLFIGLAISIDIDYGHGPLDHFMTPFIPFGRVLKQIYNKIDRIE